MTLTHWCTCRRVDFDAVVANYMSLRSMHIRNNTDQPLVLGLQVLGKVGTGWTWGTRDIVVVVVVPQADMFPANLKRCGPLGVSSLLLLQDFAVFEELAEDVPRGTLFYPGHDVLGSTESSDFGEEDKTNQLQRHVSLGRTEDFLTSLDRWVMRALSLESESEFHPLVG